MRKVEFEELKRLLHRRASGERIILEECVLENMDLSGCDLHGIVFDRSDIRNVNLTGANMSYCTARNTCFKGSCLKRANMRNAILHSADFRWCDLSGADIRGADMYASALHKADLSGIIADEHTKYFYMRCPAEGAFIGWKVCFGRKVVMLLVPADAQRVQGTTREIRCDKAKVLTIKSVDLMEQFDEAHSYVDENFIYKRGEMVYAKNYEPNRFVESAGGIHIWMSREEAVAYM